MSSSPSLPGIPAELVLEIFTLLPGRRDVAALNSTARRFYQVWRANAAAISDAVLSRSIHCYAIAEELVRFQTAQERRLETIEEEEETDEFLEIDQDQAREAYREVLKRNGRFIANAFIVADECRNLKIGGFSGFNDNHVRLRYRIHCVAALSYDRTAQNAYLGARSLSELHQMRQDSVWSNPRHYYTDFEYFRIYIKTRTARDPFELIELVHKYRWRLTYLHIQSRRET